MPVWAMPVCVAPRSALNLFMHSQEISVTTTHTTFLVVKDTVRATVLTSDIPCSEILCRFLITPPLAGNNCNYALK